MDLPFVEDEGPASHFAEEIQPFQAFNFFFNNSIADKIVDETNLYIRQKLGPVISSAHGITREELVKFIGINLLMGVKRSPSYRDYWSSNKLVRDTFIASNMLQKRFSFILSHLHLNDNDKMPKKGAPGYDRLYRLRPFIDHLNEKFQAGMKPSRNQSIDESMIKFKGRVKFVQYMPMKPIKRGYKVWVRAEKNSYVMQFQIYTGQEESSEKGLGARVIKELSSSLEGKNYNVFFDNFFNSVDLLDYLKKKGIGGCGTIRANRKYLPRFDASGMKRGDFQFKVKPNGVAATCWKDKRVVLMCSNNIDPTKYVEVQRKMKDGSKEAIKMPEVVKIYNNNMGFVDSADQMVSYYRLERKSKRWWLRIFWHLVQTTVVNAYIIYKLKRQKP